MCPTFAIRLADVNDAACIARLMIGMGFNHTPKEIERRWALISGEIDHVFLAEEGETPVGLLAIHVAPLLFYPEPIARISTLVVEPSKRKQGIGRALVNAAVSLAREAGCDTIELTTGIARKDAHAFYEAIGFQNSALRMSRRI